MSALSSHISAASARRPADDGGGSDALAGPEQIRLARVGTMDIDQATFGAVPGGKIKGYHLLAQTAGISPALGLELTRWAPVQLPANNPGVWLISSWTLSNGHVAIARTVTEQTLTDNGEPQILTMFLVLRDEQFRAYACNPLAVVRTAVELGWLRGRSDLATGPSSPATLPTTPPTSVMDAIRGRQLENSYGTLLDKVAEGIARRQSVTIIGLNDPVHAVQDLMARLSIDQRRRFSFTTGLSPSIRRPLQMHFLYRPDLACQRILESQNTVCFHATAEHRAIEAGRA
jgi:hypothetical protein